MCIIDTGTLGPTMSPTHMNIYISKSPTFMLTGQILIIDMTTERVWELSLKASDTPIPLNETKVY